MLTPLWSSLPKFLFLWDDCNSKSVDWMNGSCSSESLLNARMFHAIQLNRFSRYVHVLTRVHEETTQSMLDLVITTEPDYLPSVGPRNVENSSHYEWHPFQGHSNIIPKAGQSCVRHHDDRNASLESKLAIIKRDLNLIDSLIPI